ncbi:MAG: two-component system, LuxR family, response regulator FixJ [Candidatus Binatota bacterium]|jgi:FixJ family two-component response regulator|nr:two-component system, LuxR family, response regulator FixJ [Candidatus Binatota bacterium]
MKEAESTVFVVDDDAALRESLGWLFESAGLRVKSYSTAQEFLTAYSAEEPGCLLLDVRMPGLSGLDLQEELRRHGLPPPIIIMTGHARVPTAVRALKGGAIDFIKKPFSDRSVLDRILRAIDLDRRTRQVRVECTRFASRLASLTARERQVMNLVIAGKPNKIIAADLGISSKTVEIHRSRVMDKMEVDSVAELVRLDVLHRANQVENAGEE